MSRLPVATGALAVLVVLFLVFFDGWVGDALTITTFGLAGVIAIRVAVVHGDWLNSLTLLLILCLIRFGWPGIPLFNGDWTGPTGSYAESFAISQPEAVYGARLAAIGVLGVILGWYLSPRALVRPLTWVYGYAKRMRADPRLVPVAVGVLALGVVAALINLTLIFGNPLSAVVSGEARGTGVPGAARYGRFAVSTLTVSSVILSLYWASSTRKSMLIVLLPALFATVVLTAFGGRVNALTPLAVSYIGARFIRWQLQESTTASHRRITPRLVIAPAAVVVLLLGYVVFVPQYRGGGGVSAISTVPSRVTGYVERAPWTDAGLLHSYALAGRMGAGSMDGSSYPGLLGLPGEWLGLESENPGNVLVERLRPVKSNNGFGIHTGLVADVFLNTGLFAAVLAAIVYGMFIRAEYVASTRAPPTVGSALLHGFVLWNLMWIFFRQMSLGVGRVIHLLPVVLVIVAASYLLRRRTE